MNRTKEIWLPVPPSTNTYYRIWQGRALISRKGRDYLKNAQTYCQEKKIEPGRLNGRLKLCIKFVQPDRRKRDIDNFCGKALLDTLQKLGFYEDDVQIYKLRCEKVDFDDRGVLEPGMYITLEEIK